MTHCCWITASNYRFKRFSYMANHRKHLKGRFQDLFRHDCKARPVLRPWFHVKIKLFFKNLDPSVGRLKIILFQHGTTSKISLKNFSINIHEAVLQPIAAFVYCNPRQQQAVAGRQKSEISTRRSRLRN